MEQASQVEQLLSQAIQAFASDPYVYEICHDFSVERLGLLEYQFLDTYEESIQLKRYLYPENERAMDTFYIELLQTMTHELQHPLDAKHEKAITTIIAFLKQEAL